mmetsp:Transcript_28738/g.43844  ORF Transcript_28738/g.43844 Transcript_28738/m.43844 type:complete len:264 (-) Transcript_28738:100-891(-)
MLHSKSLILLISSVALCSCYVTTHGIGSRRASTQVLASFHKDDAMLIPNEGRPITARGARIILPSLLVLGGSLPANAGIGQKYPFDISLKKNFPGSLMNSVIMLRLASSLRKRGYMRGKASVATLKASELGVLLSRQFGDGTIYNFDEKKSLDDYIASCEGKRALVLFGPDTAISPEGEVSEIKGMDVKSAEKFVTEKLINDKLWEKVDEVTLLGGVVIQRSKTGVDKGEDCFQPLLIKTLTRNGVKDLYEEAFGDLLTPRIS